MRWPLSRGESSLVLLWALIGCGGRVGDTGRSVLDGGQGGAGATLDGEAASDATAAGAVGTDESASDARALVEGGTTNADLDAASAAPADGGADARPSHRSSGSACPQQRGAGDGPTSGQTSACVRDSDCAAGTHGRCMAACGPPGCSGTVCSYDECSSDSDCPAHVPCACRASASDNAANVCLTGSNCAVDSECGPGGFCSPSPLCVFTSPSFVTARYYCRTTSDICTIDGDCPPSCFDSGFCEPTVCRYDNQSSKWSCVRQCIPPP
jgi:hypothetical protein